MIISAEINGDFRKISAHGTVCTRGGKFQFHPQKCENKELLTPGLSVPKVELAEKHEFQKGKNYLPRGYEFQKRNELHIYIIYIGGSSSSPPTYIIYNPARGVLPKSRRTA